MSDIYNENDVNANTNVNNSNNTSMNNQMYTNGMYQNQVNQNDMNNQSMANNQTYQNGTYQNQMNQNGMNNQGMTNNQMYQNGMYQNQMNQNNMNNQGMANNQMYKNGAYQNQMNQNGMNNQGMVNNQMYQSSPYQSSPYPSSGAEAYANNANVPNNQAYAYASGTYNQNPANATPYVGENVETANPGDEISTKKYNMIIGFTLLWGFFFNFIIVSFVNPISMLATLGNAFYIIYFVSAFAGVLMFKKSSNPVMSFIGYNLLVLPLGLLLSIVLYGVDSSLIGTAILLTGIITLAMMTVGVIFSKAFEKIGSAIGVALLVSFLVELIALVTSAGEIPMMNYVVVLIFSLYIGYDWGKANAMPKTVDNAIDGAAAIYLDIINLFIRILAILAKSKRR